MKFRTVLALSSVLFKSHLRSSRGGNVTFSSNPRVMVLLDVTLFSVPLALVWYVTGLIPADLVSSLRPLVVQGLLSVPLLMTAAVVVAGLMFELGQGSAVSSSEAVNWLPVTPVEYVAASSISTSSVYSAILAVAAGGTLPLAWDAGVLGVWPLAVVLSVLGLFLGAFIVEILRAATNRVSSSVYRRGGRIGLAARLVALILLMVLFALIFQPTVLYWVLGWIQSGVEAAWVAPIVWPSLALISMAASDFSGAAIFSVLSLLFALFVYALAAFLRRMYWSPIPVSITVGVSSGYVPESTGALAFGFNPLEHALAMKEFRALFRKKDLSRYLAVPITISIAFLLPILLSGDASSAPVLLLAAMIPFIVPLMFSSISIGQEGTSMTTLLSIPLTPTELMKGKLAPAWLISGIATAGVIVLAQLISPVGLIDVMVVAVAASILIFANAFIGLGVGTRWPDYTVGKSTYVTMRGYFAGFALAGLTTVAVCLPVALHLFLVGGVGEGLPPQVFDTLPTLLVSMGLGGLAILLSYRFCRKGVVSLLGGSGR